MIFYKEIDYNGTLRQNIDSLVGSQISLKDQFRNGSSGSALFRLRETKLNNKLSDDTYLNLRCNFEKRTNGLILRINQNQKLMNIAIDFDSIIKIMLFKKEVVSPRFFSPMRLLLKLGMSIRYARYFSGHRSYYIVEPLDLIIKTSEGIMRLDSNGYNFYNTFNYFSKAGLKEKIEVIE